MWTIEKLVVIFLNAESLFLLATRIKGVRTRLDDMVSSKNGTFSAHLSAISLPYIAKYVLDLIAISIDGFILI